MKKVTVANKVKDRIGVEEYRWLCTRIQALRTGMGCGFDLLAFYIAGARKGIGAPPFDVTAAELRSIENEMKKLMGANYTKFAENSQELLNRAFAATAFPPDPPPPGRDFTPPPFFCDE